VVCPFKQSDFAYYPRETKSVSEDVVRKLMTLTLASSAVVAMACGKDKSPTSTAMSADLKRDLQLASVTRDIRINPDEVTQTSRPDVALKSKRAPQGPKVIRSQRPTVKASATPVEVAEAPAEIPQVQSTAPAPAPSEAPAPDAPPLARPSAIPVSYPGGGNSQGSGAGQGQGNGGIGGVLGGIFGAVIRGGGIGDDDHCDPRGRRGGSVTDVYSPNGRSTPIGMGGSRIPMRPMGRPRG
jgi:hypothetical protein